MRLPTMSRKAIQVLWMILVFLAVIMIVKEPVELFAAPRMKAIPNTVDNQQLGSLKELIMMENLPSTKWIVLDGLSSNCSDVTPFTQHLKWRVVVVISKWEGYITGCSFPRCTIISEENHESLLTELALTQMMKKPTKLSGYLYAIYQGADIIMDSVCSNSAALDPSNFLFSNGNRTVEKLMYNDSILFNPFEHFGYQSHYSRTFLALQNLRESSNPLVDFKGANSEIYYLQQMAATSIQQGVSTCHALCDHQDRSGHIPSMPVFVGAKTVGVLDSGPTIFHRNAFLWMFLPIGFPERIQSIFRALFIHGIRTFTNTPITYFPIWNSSTCSCATGSKDYVKMDEVRFKEFLQWIDNTSCKKNTVIAHCMLDVLRKVMDIIEGKNIPFNKRRNKMRAFLMAWLDDLTYLGLDDVFYESKVNQYNRYIYESGKIKIKYAFQRDVWKSTSPQQKIQLQKNVFERMHSICPNLSSSHPPLRLAQWKNPLMKDVMLVIVINYESLFKSSPYLEYLHRHFFKYIVYCGPGVEHFRDYAKENGLTYITFIDGLSQGWVYMYECMAYAMKLGMPVKGYLQIGDDTLIHTRKLLDIPKDYIWMPGGYDKKDLYKTKTLDYWGHWSHNHGRPAVINVFNELHSVNASESLTIMSADQNITITPQYRSFARRFLQTYDRNIGLNMAVHRAIDIFYIPDAVKSDYIIASDLFRRHGSIVEMAVPIIHFGLLPKEKVRYLRGASLWRKDREKPWTFYDINTMSFLHPFKSLLHLNDTEGQKFFCESFLPSLFTDTGVNGR